MKKFIATTVVSLCAVTVFSLDMQHYNRRQEKGAYQSLKGHFSRAHAANDQKARYSPEIEAQDGKGQAMLYLISKIGAERQWVLDKDYEQYFRHQGFHVESEQIAQQQ